MANSRTGARSFQIRSKIDFAGLRSKLRSEHGPAAHSEAEIAGALADIDKDLEDCDAEADRLQSRIISIQNQLRHLDEKKRNLKEYRSGLRFLRSPIRKIHSEQLRQIFDFACELNEITSKKLGAMPTLSISGVCLQWRKEGRKILLHGTVQDLNAGGSKTYPDAALASSVLGHSLENRRRAHS